jgi:hypothetical protein
MKTTTQKEDAKRIDAALKGRGLGLVRKHSHAENKTQRRALQRKLGCKVKHIFALGLEEL